MNAEKQFQKKTTLIINSNLNKFLKKEYHRLTCSLFLSFIQIIYIEKVIDFSRLHFNFPAGLFTNKQYPGGDTGLSSFSNYTGIHSLQSARQHCIFKKRSAKKQTGCVYYFQSGL